MLGALRTFENDISGWLPNETANEEFQENFGAEVFLAVSWDGCTVDAPELNRFVDALKVMTVEPEQSLAFDQLTSSRSLLQKMTQGPAKLPDVIAKERIRGWMLGGDDTACIVARATDAGWEQRHEIVEQVERLGQLLGIEAAALRLGGPVRSSVEVDRMGLHYVAPLAVLCFVVTVVSSFVTLRRPSLVFPVLIYATASWMSSLCLLYLTGGALDSVLIAIPALVFVLAASAAIHMTGYLQSVVRRSDSPSPIRATLRMGFIPCSIATVTTLIGLFSLTVSHMKPVCDFGIFSAFGVMAAWLALFTLWPMCVLLFDSCGSESRRRLKESQLAEQSQLAKNMVSNDRNETGAPWWQFLFETSTRHARLWLIGSIAILPILGFGLASLESSVGVADMFAANTDVRDDYQWFESEIAGLIPFEVVLEMPSDDEAVDGLLEQIALVSEVRDFVNEIPLVSGVLSATSFMPSIPTGTGFSATIRRRVVGAKIREGLAELETQDLLTRSDGRIFWRITGRVPGMRRDVDHAKFLENLKTKVAEFLKEHVEAEEVLPKLSVAGSGFVVARAQQLLLVDMGKSLLLAFGLIAIAMILICRSIGLGVIAMLPNIFPTLLLFGGMGLFGFTLDSGAMITTTVALGIAVDDTSHFLWWFSHCSTSEPARAEAAAEAQFETADARSMIYRAFGHCATPMLRTTVICGLGIGMFAFSPFLPVAKFGALMTLLLIAALVGDLILLPALLALAHGSRKRRTIETGQGA